MLKEESIKKVKEELPTSADESIVKEEPISQKASNVLSETEKDSNDDTDKCKDAENMIESKDTADVSESKDDVTEFKDATDLTKSKDTAEVTEDLDTNEIKREEGMNEDVAKNEETVVKTDEEAPSPKKIKEEPETSEQVDVFNEKNTSEEIETKEEVETKEVASEKVVDMVVVSNKEEIPDSEPSYLNEEPMDVDSIADTSGELKIDEDAKAEDEETDIEMDMRKEDEEPSPTEKSEDRKEEETVEKEEETVEKEEPAKPNSPAAAPPAVVAEENEKEDQKYDCDTDTESKVFEQVPPIENEESPLVKMERVIKSEMGEGGISEKMFSKVKQEEGSFDEGLREKYNIRKMFPKDELLHSHVEDSQVGL